MDHAAERYKVLQANAESYKKEIAALQDKSQKYSTSVAKHELTITQLKEVNFVFFFFFFLVILECLKFRIKAKGRHTVKGG